MNDLTCSETLDLRGGEMSLFYFLHLIHLDHLGSIEISLTEMYNYLFIYFLFFIAVTIF